MNVLLDLDGTLTDSRPGIVACFKHALAALRRPVPEDAALENLIGTPLRDALGKLLGVDADNDVVEEAVAGYRERYASAGLFESTVYEGMPDALAALAARGTQLFVATSKARIYAERIIEHFGLSRYFDAVYGSELDGGRSDKTELIRHALSRSNLLARDTVMVGDRRHDVIGALNNRVTPIGVLWGYGSRSELTAAGAAQLLTEPGEIARLERSALRRRLVGGLVE